MPYCDLTFRAIRKKFGITNTIGPVFSSFKKIPISSSLAASLAIAARLPVRTEKAKSEFIVLPILLDLMEQNKEYFTIYSGESLNVDKETDLVGECDFILAKNTKTFDINTPIFTLVEAKKNDITLGIPQCAAQMIGARIYNEEAGTIIPCIYGCITTGDAWQFLKLEGSLITVDDRKYFLSELEVLLGALQRVIDLFRAQLES